MDGNGRWARQRHQPNHFGHNAGRHAIREVVKSCLTQPGIEVLTLFAFSSENWNRPQEEVSALMRMFLHALNKEVDELHKQGVCLRFIGELSTFSTALQRRMRAAMKRTSNNQKLHVNLAVGYGGRWDMVQATRHVAEEVEDGKLTVTDINEEVLGRWVNLSDLPPLDLFIRTGGEYRVSNFLLWQIAYAELYFTDVLWPDFSPHCLRHALDTYASRERRFGRTSSQIMNI